MRPRRRSSEISVRYTIDRRDIADSVTDNWDREATKLVKNDFGVWEITLPAVNGQPAIPHESKVKVRTRSCHIDSC